MLMHCNVLIIISFFFNDPATTELYTLSLHDALPISPTGEVRRGLIGRTFGAVGEGFIVITLGALYGGAILTGLTIFSEDRKSTRLNSSHVRISYAVFCLKKKKKKKKVNIIPTQERIH